MIDKQDILKTVQHHAAELKGLGVKRLELFGSYANDTARHDSDIDFLVEFEAGRGGLDDYIQSLRLLEEILQNDVDLVKQSLIKESYKDSVLGGDRVEAKL